MNESRWKWIAVLALGMVAGLAMAQVLSVRSVSAQPRQWQECFVAGAWPASARDFAAGNLPTRIRVAGWVPVGGSTVSGGPGIVLCR